MVPPIGIWELRAENASTRAAQEPVPGENNRAILL